MERSIIQITAAGNNGMLYALCDDGTVWAVWVTGNGSWIPMDRIPQHKLTRPPKDPIRQGEIT